MAKTDNLDDYLADLADGIRSKKGTSEPINPQDFSTEIESIEGGGSGGGSSASTIEYISVEGKDLLEWGEVFSITAFLVKMPTEIVPISLLITMGENVNDAKAFAIDPTMSFDFQGERMTIADFYVSMGVDLSTYNRIAKEQFYSLE